MLLAAQLEVQLRLHFGASTGMGLEKRHELYEKESETASIDLAHFLPL
jgi:hypothetical protein